jgi:hypothetical protein
LVAGYCNVILLRYQYENHVDIVLFSIEQPRIDKIKGEVMTDLTANNKTKKLKCELRAK